MPLSAKRQAAGDDGEPPGGLWGEVVGEELEPAEPKGLLADLEVLLRTHLSRLAGRLEGHLGRQEELLQRLAEGTCRPLDAEFLPQLSEPSGHDLLARPVWRRRFLTEGVHGAWGAEQAFGSSESSAGSSFERFATRLRKEEQEEAEEFRLGEEGAGKALSRSSSKTAPSDISRLSDILEEHMSRHQDLFKPNKGLFLNSLSVQDQDGAEPKPSAPPGNLASSSGTVTSSRPEDPPGPIHGTNDLNGSHGTNDLNGSHGTNDLNASEAEAQESKLSASKMSKASRKMQSNMRDAHSFASQEEQLRITHMQVPRQESYERAKMEPPRQHRWKALADRIAQSGYFESCCCVLILSNTLFFGIEVEVLAQSENGTAPGVFQAITYIYTVLFTWELLFRIGAERRAFLTGPFAGWNCLDTVIVVISLIEMALDTVAGSNGGNLAYVRIIRMARVIRVLRVLRVMRFVRSLRILVHSVLNTVRSLFWTMLLLAMILYLFAILFTQAATQYRTEGDAPPNVETLALLKYYFGSVPVSVYTLFKSITNGVSWEDVVEPLSNAHWMWVALFVSFIAFTYLAVLNVVTGVFCQTAIESANQDQDMVVQEQLLSKAEYSKSLKKIFRHIDSDNTGDITLLEFEERLKDPKLQAYFGAMEITVDEAWNLFKLLDADESHVIDIDEFVSGCLRLRGNARTMDIAMLLYQSKWSMSKLAAITRSIEDQWEFLTDQFDKGSQAGRRDSARDCPMPIIGSEAHMEGGDEDGAGAQKKLRAHPAPAHSRWAQGVDGKHFEISGL